MGIHFLDHLRNLDFDVQKDRVYGLVVHCCSTGYVYTYA